MNRYCKKCATERPHVKAGVQGRQMWQCGICGKRHIEQAGKKQSPTVTVAVRFGKEELAHLEALPGSTRSARIRNAVKAASLPPVTGEQEAISGTSPEE